MQSKDNEVILNKKKTVMKAGRKRQTITEKEAVLMNMLWNDGPLFVREMLDRYPEPKPHFNTIATTIRILEKKGHVGQIGRASCRERV